MENWMACHDRKTRWCVGANMFPCDDMAPWEAKANQFLREYREVKESEPPKKSQRQGIGTAGDGRTSLPTARREPRR